MKDNHQYFKMKLTVLLIAALAICFALAGCGGEEDPVATPTASATQAPDTATPTTAVPDPTSAVAPEKYEHFSANGIVTNDTGYMRSDLTSLEVVELMGNGINLGNTMEAYGHKSLGTSAKPSSYEVLWGQPVTTQAMITAMKEGGFDSLRIPIAWTNMMNFESGDYTIDPAYLDRVEEIINYALNADMYVVINDHWDGGWWGKFGSATESIRAAAMEQYISMWTQIANRYKEYSDYLIFESANEELGNRLNDLDLCPDSGSLSTDECYRMVTEINQAFVDTVRGTGGNNTQRFLLIAGYNTDIEMTCDNRYKMPTDTAVNKLLLSVHYYTPFGYCGSTSLSTWGTAKNYNEMNQLLQMMTKYTEQGYGIVIGEYSVALKDDGTVKDNTCDFLKNFLDNCDLYGYCPMLWDCSSQFKRKTLSFLDQKVENLFYNRSYSIQSELTTEEIKTNATDSMALALQRAEEADEKAGNQIDPNKAMAWLMYNSSDWNTLYCSGDTYDPTSITAGTVATDVEITGEGTYTIGLDFSGTSGGFANSVVFSAIGIANGETLFPGYIINVEEIIINGEPYSMTGKPYTTSDNGICTRLNLYNAWVTVIPYDNARTLEGSKEGLSTTILNPDTVGNVKTIYVTFSYTKGK